MLEHGCTVMAQKPSSSHSSNQEKKTLKPKWCWLLWLISRVFWWVPWESSTRSCY